MKTILPLILMFAVVACDESLPPRVEPTQFLDVQSSITPGVVVFIDSVSQGIAGSFDIRVKNVYAEVLQAPELARAEISVWLRAAPEHRATVVMTKSQLQNQSIVYNGLLTLVPQNSALFLKQWNHRTGEGKGFWEFVHLTEKLNSRGERYYESDPVALSASGRVQLFRDVQAQKFPQIDFSIVYRVFVPIDSTRAH